MFSYNRKRMIFGVSACPHGKGGSTPPPAPDPSIGQAQLAESNLEAQEYSDYKNTFEPQQLAQEQQANSIDQQQEQSEAALQASETASSNNYNDMYQNTYEPLMKNMVNEATNYDSDGNFQQQAQLAIGDVNNTYGAQQQSQAREMQSVGVDPTSGAYQGMWNANGINQAGAQAAAATRARTAAQQLGWNMQTQAAQMGQALPGDAVANDSAATNSGNSATSASNSGVSNAVNTGSAGTAATSSAASIQQGIGQLGAGSYQTQVNAWNDQQQQQAASSAGLGSAIGSVAGIAAMAMM